jgi:hypothetical protein
VVSIETVSSPNEPRRRTPARAAVCGRAPHAGTGRDRRNPVALRPGVGDPQRVAPRWPPGSTTRASLSERAIHRPLGSKLCEKDRHRQSRCGRPGSSISPSATNRYALIAHRYALKRLLSFAHTKARNRSTVLRVLVLGARTHARREPRCQRRCVCHGARGGGYWV